MSAPSPDEALQTRLKEEATMGRLPLTRDEREYSTKGILATGFTYAVAAWCFLIGGYAAKVVGATQGVVTLIAGCVIGVAISAAAAALACNKYGLEQIDYCKTSFGQRGAKVILLFYVINQIGWTGVILVMFGRGVQNLTEALGWTFGENLIRIAVFAGILIAYLIVIGGVHVLNIFNSIVTPGLIAVTLFLFYMIFRQTGWSGLAALPPTEPASDPALGYVIAFEYGLGAGFSWWPGIGFLTRNTDNQRNSLYPQVLTMGLGMGVVCCTGLLAGLLFKTYDPTVWVIKVGGRAMGALALLLVAIANVSASAIMMYTASLGLRHIGFFKSTGWRKLTAGAFAPVLCYAAFPLLFYEKGDAFLAYNATMFSPIAAVLFVDFFFLRKQRLNLSQIFEDHPTGHYRYLGGFNWAALVAMAAGQILYLWLFNPVTNEVHGPVRQLTATLPSVFTSMILYYLLARVWLIPAKLGGYNASEAPSLPLKEPNI
jgi:NCS1 family nucleobase:cation symporter-1